MTSTTSSTSLWSARAFTGLANQMRRESAAWWTTGRWWRQTLIWTTMLTGLFVLLHWVLPAVAPAEAGLPDADIAMTAQQFTELAAIVTAIGVVLLAQGLVLDERRNGVLEWLLSKPLSRPALIGGKFAGNAAGLVVPVVVLPWIAVHVLLSVAAGTTWPVWRTLATVGMLALVVVFHLALVLAISTVTDSRITVLALPLVMIVGADLVSGLAPSTFEVLPWSLGPIAGAFLAQAVLVTPGPILASAGWTALLLVAAMAAMQRTEL